MITVLIPTANRPDYLRTALRSVQRQSALGKISKVIVSEHLGNRASEQVCKEFEELPIQYFFRDPDGDAKRGFLLMLQDVKTELLAVLFDDDWWGVDHIAHGVRGLATEPSLSCYFAAYFMVEGERSLLRCHPTVEFWHGTGFSSFETEWTLTLNDTVAACLVDVPCTYSSMIAPTDTFAKAYSARLDVGNPYDSDRIMTLELAKQGPIMVNPIPEVFVRFHSGQDKNRFSVESIKQYKRLSIQHLLTICRQRNINPGKEFDRRIASAPEDVCSAICQSILNDCEDLIAGKIIDSEVLFKYWQATREREDKGRHGRAVRKVLKQILPPVVVDCGNMIRRRMTDGRPAVAHTRPE
jgi:hypothetical protein